MGSHSSLNHVYRTVWNESLGAMVAVAENASSHSGPGAASGRSVVRRPVAFARWATVCQLSLAVALSWGLTRQVSANPTGGTAVQGQATMVTQGNVLTVTTQNALGTNASAINWQSFSIPAGHTTRIDQPNAASMSINRVVTNTPSVLLGTLSSNGKVVLVNQSGIAVGAGAQVDTAGFTASTLGMSEQDAKAGRLRFGSTNIDDSSGALTVQGNIIGRGGDVVLIAPSIELAQTAVVESQGGSVLLAAGRSVEVTGRGLEGISLQVQAPADQAINLGTLKGDAVGIFAGTLKHSGLIQATQVSVEGGRVVLKASGDAYVEGNGKILATSTEGKGGQVSVLGNRVALTDNAHIDVSGATGGGTVLVGGDYQGKNPEVQNAAISYVGKDTRIVADATGNGDGGKVIIWADDTTRSYGYISARGGANGGNGGFVETSGHRYLDFQGKVDTRAPLGTVGSLLLDPSDITINAAGPDANIAGLGSGTLTSSPTVNSIMTWATLNTQLGLGNLIITTDSFGSSGPGNINITASGTLTPTNTLTLKAHNNINIGTGVAVNLAADVNLIAGWSGTGNVVTPDAGIIDFGATSSLTTPGKVWLNAGDNVTQATDSVITANSMAVTTSAASSTNPVNLLGPNQVGTLSGSMTGVNARFEYWSGAAGVTVGTVTVPGPTNIVGISTNNGDIVLKGASSGNTVVNANVNGGTGVTSIKQLGTGSTTINAGMTVTGDTVQLETGAPTSTLVSNGAIVAGSGGATLTVPGGITVNGITSSGVLSMTSTNTPITQSGSNPIVVTGATTVSAGTGDIVLTTAGNNFSSISLSGGSVQVKDANALNVTSLTNGSNKKVMLVAGGALTLPVTVINTGTDDLELGSGTTLTPQNHVIGTNVKLVGTAGVNVEFDVTASGTLDMSASAGSVTQNTSTGVGVITAIGATTINAGAGTVLLDMPSNNFSSINATGTGAVTVYDTDALVLKGLKGSGITLVTGGAVTQAAGIVETTGTFDVTSVGGVSLTNTNKIRTLIAVNTSSGSFTLKNQGLLDMSISNNTGTGIVTVDNTGDLKLLNTGVISGATGTAVVLATGGNFLNVNNFGITLTGAGAPRWLIYSTNPALNTVGAVLTPAVGFQQYATVYPGSAVQASGNGLIYSGSSTPVTASLVGSVSKVFDGTTTATLSTSNYAPGTFTDALFGGSTGVAVNGAGVGTYDTPNAGTGKTVTVSGGIANVSFAGGKQIYGVQLASGSASIGTITPAPITVVPVSAALVGTTSKIYDGTTIATLTPSNFQLSGFVGTDYADVTQTVGVYTSKDVGNGILVNTSLTASDFKAGGTTLLSNYTLPSTASGNIGVITPRPLTLAASAANKVFDGTTVATVTSLNLSGFVTGETLSATSKSANFDTREVGNDKTVTIDGVSLIDGTGLAGNYSVTGSVTTRASITSAIAPVAPVVPVVPVVPVDSGRNTSGSPNDFVATFSEKFQVAVLEHDQKKDGLGRAVADVVLEGEICRP